MYSFAPLIMLLVLGTDKTKHVRTVLVPGVQNVSYGGNPILSLCLRENGRVLLENLARRLLLMFLKSEDAIPSY